MVKIKLKTDQLNKKFPSFQGVRSTLSYLPYSQLHSVHIIILYLCMAEFNNTLSSNYLYPF
jgi:hypothetical protein